MRRLALALGVALSVSAAAGERPRGEAVYDRCLACHALERNVVGPKHCGLFGRRAGAVPGFDYSPAMKRSKIVWDEKTLDRFLADPMKTLPGTSRTFAGVPDARERADLIAWLRRATACS